MSKTFRELAVDTHLADALEANGITTPFPIQETTLPLALAGADLIGQARTGTGKTLAFGIPVLQRIDPTRDVTQALVIVPTRELCLQVTADLMIGERRGLRIVSVYGGVGYDEQTDALNGGAHVVVGTPGRLLDLLEKRILPLDQVTELVLDEADEMLDMGFLPDVERLIEACTNDARHTMLFSATMPSAIVTLGRRYLTQPTFMRAEAEERFTAPQVVQHFFLVHRMDKPRLLARILQDENRGGVFVFVRTKHMADRLVDELSALNTPAVAVHGDLRQSMREKNLDKFRSGKATVLVCTEVAARGLDISGVTHVVNYDCPDDDKMYLHRIGRTARAGAKGSAITFAEYNEVERLNVIRKAVGAADNEPVEAFSTSALLAERFTLPTARPWDKTGSTASTPTKPRDQKTARPAESGAEKRKRSSKPRSANSQAAAPQPAGASVDAPAPTAETPAATRVPAATDAGGPATAANEKTARPARVRTRSRRVPSPTAGDGTAATSATTETARTAPTAPAVPTRTRAPRDKSSTPVTPKPTKAPVGTSTEPAASRDDGASDTPHDAGPAAQTQTAPKPRAPRAKAAKPVEAAPRRNTQPSNATGGSTAPSTDPLQQIRGTGIPRTARRVLVEHLP